MAANSFEQFQGKSHLPAIKDGNGNLAINSSSLQLNKRSFDEAGSLDVLPLLVKDAFLPTGEEHTLSRAIGQDVCTVLVSPDEDNSSPRRGSQFSLMSFLKAFFPPKSQLFLDAQLNCQKAQNCLNLLLEGPDGYGSCVVDINVEKGNSETAKLRDGIVASMKTENVHTQKVLQRQASLNTDKGVPERAHDAPSNRWRRYKRATSFDSRKIVILFSILSSIGTLILIYLTLRVKQTAEGFHQD